MLIVDFSRQAEAFLRKLPAKHARQIAERIVALAKDPQHVAAEPLRGHPPLMRLRAGEYRVIFTIEDATLAILLVGKRNDDEIFKLVERFRR